MCERRIGVGDGVDSERVTKGLEPDRDPARGSRIETATSEDGSVVRTRDGISFYGTLPTLVLRRPARPVNQAVYEDRARPVNQGVRASEGSGVGSQTTRSAEVGRVIPLALRRRLRASVESAHGWMSVWVALRPCVTFVLAAQAAVGSRNRPRGAAIEAAA